MLFHLATHPDATVGDITTALGGSPAGVSGLLTRMEKTGLITRTPDPHDRRTLHVALTPTGRDALTHARAALEDLNGHLTDGFTPEELATVHRWLTHATHLPDDPAPGR